MRKNSLWVVTTCALASVLVAARCSDDDETSNVKDVSSATEAAPADALKDPSKDAVDGGVETDPLGGAIGGEDDGTAPVEDEAGMDDIGLDAEPATEPAPEVSP